MRRLTSPLVLAFAIVGVEALLVLGALGQSGVPILGGDGPEYDALARNLVDHGTFSAAAGAPYPPSVMRAPGYPAFLAVLYGLGLDAPSAVRLAQFALLALLGVVVAALAARLGGPREARLAAVLTVTYLPLVWLATYHLTELGSALLLALTVLLVVTAQAAARAGKPRTALWPGAGLALAAACYVRPSLLGLGGVFAAGIVLTAPGPGWSWRRWLPGVAFLAAMVVAILPWTVRASRLGHAVIPLAATSGGSSWASASQYTGQISLGFNNEDWRRYKAVSRDIAGPRGRLNLTPTQQVAFDRAFRARAPWDEVTAGDIARGIPGRIAHLWGPVDTTPRRELWTSSGRRLAWLQYAALALLTAAGLALRRRSLLREWPLWMPAIYLTFVHMVFHVESRYSVSARPLLLVYAAVGAALVADRVRDARTGARPRAVSA